MFPNKNRLPHLMKPKMLKTASDLWNNFSTIPFVPIDEQQFCFSPRLTKRHHLDRNLSGKRKVVLLVYSLSPNSIRSAIVYQLKIGRNICTCIIIQVRSVDSTFWMPVHDFPVPLYATLNLLVWQKKVWCTQLTQVTQFVQNVCHQCIPDVEC